MVLFINDVTKLFITLVFSTERSQKSLTIHYKGMTSFMGDPWLETQNQDIFWRSSIVLFKSP